MECGEGLRECLECLVWKCRVKEGRTRGVGGYGEDGSFNPLRGVRRLFERETMLRGEVGLRAAKVWEQEERTKSCVPEVWLWGCGSGLIRVRVLV